MWEWIINEIKKIDKKTHLIKKIPASVMQGKGVTKEDIIQEIILYFLNNKELAEKIYEERNTGLLYKIIKIRLCESKIKNIKNFNNTTEMSRYLRINEIYKKYGIEKKKENAYKIFCLIESNKWNDFSISGIIKLLSIEQTKATSQYNEQIDYEDKQVV